MPFRAARRPQLHLHDDPPLLLNAPKRESCLLLASHPACPSHHYPPRTHVSAPPLMSLGALSALSAFRKPPHNALLPLRGHAPPTLPVAVQFITETSLSAD